MLGNSFFQKYKRIEISHRKISTETIFEISMQRCTFVQKEINLKYLTNKSLTVIIVNILKNECSKN